MRRLLITHILFFQLPFWILVIILFNMDAPLRFRYARLKGDCVERGQWIYNRLFDSDTAVDILFVGSSHTMNAVIDTMVENNVSCRQKQRLHVLNLGYCRFGRNAEVELLSHVLKTKHPKKVFIEIREEESYASHPVFPLLADASEITESLAALNTSFFYDANLHLRMNIAYLLSRIFQQQKDLPVNTGLYGYLNNDDAMNEKAWQERVGKRKKKWETVKSGYSENIFEKIFSRFYVEKLIGICRAHHISYEFIYLPECGNPARTPCNLAYYKAFKKPLIAPDSIFEKPSNWRDEAHFNNKGAVAYTQWLLSDSSLWK